MPEKAVDRSPEEQKTKQTLYAKYLLGQMSASELAYNLKVLNSVESHYEIQNSRKNFLSPTQFKDVPTTKPGEQLNPTVSDLQPVKCHRQARELLNYETCSHKKEELQRVYNQRKQQDLQQRLYVMIANENVLRDCYLKSQKVLEIVRNRIKSGLKVALKGAKAFTKFKEKLTKIKNKISLLLGTDKNKVRSRNLTTSMMNERASKKTK
ncbi:MAG: hypothetical protein NZT61_02190 [Deltaproteobacteria bacterium]|nr:hypothetical protein [Deltaproteobacteria bacterium]